MDGHSTEGVGTWLILGFLTYPKDKFLPHLKYSVIPVILPYYPRFFVPQNLRLEGGRVTYDSL